MDASANVLQWFATEHSNMVDAASGGALFNKTPEEGYELIEVMASNNLLKSTDRNA